MITAINNVSFKNNNYNNVSFGKKHEKPQHEPRQSSSALKAIPLATLIAMSPLNAPSATYDFEQNPEKIIEIHEIEEGAKTTKIRLISTDGDDSDIEKFTLEVFFTRKDESYDKETDKHVPTTRSVIDCVNVDSLIVKDVTIEHHDIGLTEKRKSYYVKGETNRFESPAKATDGSGKTYGKVRQSRGQDYEYPVSEGLYNYLKQISEGIVPEGKRTINRERGYTFGL